MLCISGLAITMSNGDQLGCFGDFGMACGAPWYHSNAILSNASYRPAHVWIDRDRFNGHPYQGILTHLPDFAHTEVGAKQCQDKPTQCAKVPRFTMWRTFQTCDTITIFDTPPNYNEDGTDCKINALVNLKTKLADAVYLPKCRRLRQRSFGHGDPDPSAGHSTHSTTPPDQPNNAGAACGQFHRLTHRHGTIS